MQQFKCLFSPTRIGTIEIKNRIAMAPMGGYHPDRHISDRLIPYLEARSRGGVGLFISEGFQATRFGNAVLAGAYDDKFLPSLEKYARATKKNGCISFMQMMALGGKDSGENYAPSSIESPQFVNIPKEFSKDQIQQIVDDFVQCADRAQQAGFDGVELHGAHSYLVGQFMSPHFNRRNDEYGGDFDRRMRLPSEIMRGIRKTCGEGFPVGFKFSAWEQLPNGVNHDLAAKIAKRMANEGVVYLHVQTSDFYPPAAIWSPYPAMPPMYSPRNTLTDLSENIKKHVGNVPVMDAAGIIDPWEADALIADGKADLVAVGRALLADPEWANKAKEGRRIRPCIRCNVCHHRVVAIEQAIACTVNPHLEREAEEPLVKAKVEKNVMVVGSGPAGLWCALIASRRGHNVTLYEQQGELGGLLVPGCAPPFKRDVRDLLTYYRAEINDSKATVQLNKKVTPELVTEIKPHVLVVAIGAQPIGLSVPGSGSKHVISAVDALTEPGGVKGNHVVVVGGGEVGCEAALHLARLGKEVAVLEVLDDILSVNEIKNNSTVLRELLEKANVKIYTSSRVEEIMSSSVWISHKDGRRSQIPADSVVVSIGLRADKASVQQLMDSCPSAYSIGDCVSPARILEAVAEADRLARII
jgi:2,4-dienoyl-CoA reductase-like NADH-dependent reductase (Old Yellow Enzyme family)/thioredoxin reductase